VASILYFEDLLYVVTKIPMVDNSVPEELRCTTCLLPMQYQSKKMENFCGNVSSVENNILFLMMQLMLKNIGVHLGNFYV